MNLNDHRVLLLRRRYPHANRQQPTCRAPAVTPRRRSRHGGNERVGHGGRRRRVRVYLAGSGRGVASASVRPSALLIASKYICPTSRLSHVLAACPSAE